MAAKRTREGLGVVLGVAWHFLKQSLSSGDTAARKRVASRAGPGVPLMTAGTEEPDGVGVLPKAIFAELTASA